jgi:hypothetical protein
MRIAAACAIATRTSQPNVWRAGCCAAQTTLQIEKNPFQTSNADFLDHARIKSKRFPISISVGRKLFGK